MAKIALRQLYALPGADISFVLHDVPKPWFPELELNFTLDALKELDSNNRLICRVVCADYQSHTDFLATIWFDQNPVMIVRRDGRFAANVKRWVTNATAYTEVLLYLVQLSLRHTIETTDMLTSNDYEVYPEEIFKDVETAAKFGFNSAPARKDILLLSNLPIFEDYGSESVVALVPTNQPELPMYIRRGTCVMQKIKELTLPELVSKNYRFERVLQEKCIEHAYLFKIIEDLVSDYAQPV